MKITIADSEELMLARKGLDTLLSKKDLFFCQQQIMDVFVKYPSLKKEKFSDPVFQKKIFDAYKEFLKNLYNFDGYIRGYCQDFPFLIQMTLENEAIQNMFTKGAEEYIASLNRSVNYPDGECDTYPTDRMSGFLALEKFFGNPIISKEVQDAQIPGLLKAFGPWIAKRRAGNRYKKVYALVKSSGATEDEIAQEAYWARNHNDGGDLYREKVFDISLLQFPGFPLDKLNDRTVQENIRQYRIHHVSSGNISHIQSFRSAYPFIEEKIKNIEDILLNKKEYDEDTEAVVNFLTQGIKKFLVLAESNHAQELAHLFPSFAQAIPRSEIIEGVATGLDAYLYHTQVDEDTDKKELVKNFPFSQEEAENYITTHLDKVPDILKYFSGYDFTSLYNKPEIKKKLIARIPKQPQHADFFYAATKVRLTPLQRDMICIKTFVDGRKSTLSSVSAGEYYILRGRRISKSIKQLSNMCQDKENLKKQLNTPKVKGVLRKWAYHKISDHEFADEFGVDSSIQSLCNNEYFPLSQKEVNEEIFKLFLQNCKKGSVPYRKDRYSCINSHIANKTPALVKASMEGVIHLLSISHYTHTAAIDHLFVSISFLTKQLPFSGDERQSDAIQQALLDLKKHFLSQGRFDKIEKLEKLNAGCGKI